MIIYLRTSFGNLEPDTFFLDLVELISTTAPAITAALLACLSGYGFSTEFIAENCVGLACDGASAMLGKDAGVDRLLQNQFPKLFVWHCVAHRLELSVHDTVKEVAGVNNFKLFIDKLYSLYSTSPKNQAELRQCASDLEVQLLSIGIQVLDTRWVASSLRTVRAIWQHSYAALYNHFLSASKDTQRDSKERAVYSGLAQRLSCRHFVNNLAIMYDALQQLSELSCELQRRDVTLLSAHKSVTRQILVFEAMCNDHLGPRLKKATESLQISSFAGVPLHTGGKSDVPIRPEQFFRSLVSNLKSRMLTVQSSRVSTINTASSQVNQYDEIVTWTKVLSPEHWPEFPAPSGENELHSSLFGETEVQLLSERLNVDGRQSVRAFRRYKETGGKIIPDELRTLILALNTIPVCTAECERGFSQMNLIISPSRNCLSVKTVSCLLFAKLVGPPLGKFDPLLYVKTWLTDGKRSADCINSLACAGANSNSDVKPTYAAIWQFL